MFSEIKARLYAKKPGSDHIPSNVAHENVAKFPIKLLRKANLSYLMVWKFPIKHA